MFYIQILTEMKTIKNPLTVSALLIVIANTLFAFYSFANLPDTIPIHFGVDGTPNGWGPKFSIFLIPIINLVLSGFMISVRKQPFSYLNLPIKISQNNLEERLKLGTELLDIITLIISFLFLMIEMNIVMVSQNPNYGKYMMIAIFALIVVILGISVHYTRKINKLA
ncbi:protein of unknown function DUF1648 [Emticicia oligotrophica DSM 17448]|uniref:DUF1648 domain-containing protein n=2 Tax=Emticicia TaxID=312278 RepID=A0ABM5MYD5_EMTOG|nr:protein of unknown function DUF1648 [Emticicia oligotrophica DSM 17448]